MPSRLLRDLLRCILFCGDEEESEGTLYSSSRTASYYYPSHTNYTRCSSSPVIPSSKPRSSSLSSSNPPQSYVSSSSRPLLQSSPQSSAKPSPSSLPPSKPPLPSSIIPSSSSKPSSYSPPLSNPVPSSLPSSSLKRLLQSSQSSPIPLLKPSPSSEKHVQEPKILQRCTASLKTPQSPSHSTSSPRGLLFDKNQGGGQVLQRYEIPKHLEEQIKRDIVPEVLRRPLSPSTYADYFGALLYAEDFYIEKWSNFLLSEVSLKFQKRELFETFPRGNMKAKEMSLMKKKPFETFPRGNRKAKEMSLMEKKPFVSFEIDAIPERRPYLVSRDFVFLRRSESPKSREPFKGVLFRVVKSTLVLVDFGDDFHSQHSLSNKYDVSFSFNRVCLKRCHQAIAATMGSSLRDVLFPSLNAISSGLVLQTNQRHLDIGSRILNHKVTAPYLIQGPLSVTGDKLSTTGTVIQQAILKLYRTYPKCHILVCAPTNRSCDAIMQSILEEIPRPMLFRANAAFRDYDLVPDDIIPESLYKGECFTCPSLSELQNFKVITSTYVSSFRLHTSGVKADHFTHIFLVDASLAVEPEVAVPLANFVGKNTVVVVTGSSRNFPNWVRSDMARIHGLKTSYFERLLNIEPYASRSPMFVSYL